MVDQASVFQDQTNAERPELDLWPSIVIRRAEIDAEVARLMMLPPPDDGRRRSLIVHPQSKGPGPGLAPGIEVSLNVLNPGERSQPIRHNSTQVDFCIQGAGSVEVGQKRFDFAQHDVWNVPSMTTYAYENETDELQVRLSYSNAALLEKMNVHVVEQGPPPANEAPERVAPSLDPADTNPYGTFRLPGSDDPSYLMPYETLISPEPMPSEPLHWPWDRVRAELDKLAALGEDYRGRRLYLLYNPATGRANGTTPSFFATMTIRPPRIVDRPHRHTSAAINYFFAGSGYSIVGGERYEWSAGDLMLSAPGWEVHNHASNDEPVYELTVQDSPLNINMESLLWQEDLSRPYRVLGVDGGFDTNRDAISS